MMLTVKYGLYSLLATCPPTKMRQVLATLKPSIAQREKRRIRRITLKESISNEKLPAYVDRMEGMLSKLMDEHFPDQE